MYNKKHRLGETPRIPRAWNPKGKLRREINMRLIETLDKEVINRVT